MQLCNMAGDSKCRELGWCECEVGFCSIIQWIWGRWWKSSPMCWARNWTVVPENYWHKSRSTKRIGWRSRKRRGKRRSKGDGGEEDNDDDNNNQTKWSRGDRSSLWTDISICWGITVLAVIQLFPQQCLKFQSPQQKTSWQQKTKHAICFGKGRRLSN